MNIFKMHDKLFGYALFLDTLTYLIFFAFQKKKTTTAGHFFCPKMDQRISLLAKMCIKHKGIAVIIIITIAFTFIRVSVNSSMISVFGRLRENAKDDLDAALFIKYVFFSILSHILESMIETCSYLCMFFSETFIAHWLFARKMKTDFGEFSKFSPEEQYTDFIIKKEAFVNMISLIFFSIPMNAILAMFLFYNILTSQKTNVLRNTTLVLCVCLIYYFVSGKAASHRKNLRQVYNDSKISKNAFCRTVLDNYEVCTADRQQRARSKMFKDRLVSLASHEYKYFFLSENYRLLTRSSIVMLKLLFLFFRMSDETIAVGMILLMIDQLNQSMLRLRNDFFMLLEYWNEYSTTSIECGAAACNSSRCNTASGKERKTAFSAKECITLRLLNGLTIAGSRNIPNEHAHALLINPCTKTLIVGQPGCGKSVLLRSLIGIYSPQYEVRVGNTDVLAIEEKSLFSNISFLSQEQLIFNKSIEFNLLYGTDLTPKELSEKISLFNLSRYFEQFEHGLQTAIGSKSCGLSNGQRQMICFLRCLMRSALVYIFDEPGLFLDDCSEKLVYSLISSLSNKTVIVASQSTRHSELFDHVARLESPQQDVLENKE